MKLTHAGYDLFGANIRRECASLRPLGTGPIVLRPAGDTSCYVQEVFSFQGCVSLLWRISRDGVESGSDSSCFRRLSSEEFECPAKVGVTARGVVALFDGGECVRISTNNNVSVDLPSGEWLRAESFVGKGIRRDSTVLKNDDCCCCWSVFVGPERDRCFAFRRLIIESFVSCSFRQKIHWKLAFPFTKRESHFVLIVSLLVIAIWHCFI